MNRGMLNTFDVTTRKVNFKPNKQIVPCPKCGNNISFVAKSEQVCEDGCEVWIECKCGYNPFGSGDKIEDVWGGVGDENVYASLHEWNNLLSSEQNPEADSTSDKQKR